MVKRPPLHESATGVEDDFTMAFQPIVDVERKEIFAHEALLRGVDGRGAAAYLATVPLQSKYAFDQACREKAIELASAAGLQSKLSLNLLPNAVHQLAGCLDPTIATAERLNFPIDRLIFEVTETERVCDMHSLASIFRSYAHHGFATAIDDFGAGFAGLELLATFQPEIIKIDIHLVRNIHLDPVRSAIVKGIMSTCVDLDITVIAEGVESREEVQALRGLGIELFQGYVFARPCLQSLPQVNWAAAQ